MPNRIAKHGLADVQAEYFQRHSRKRSTSTSQGRHKHISKNSKRYKTLLTCVVCAGDAHGYNFDAISCESCKAFFRRNALRPLERFKCRGHGCCDVKFNVRKRCKRCRLEQCIRAGMRKEWILSDQEKAEKRAKIEENRRLRQISDNEKVHNLTKQCLKSPDTSSLYLSPSSNQTVLNDFDWFSIQFVQDCFLDAIRLNQIAGISFYPSVQSIESTEELFSVPLHIISMRLITYIKQINEFQNLTKDDQVYLVKLNLLTICFFHSIFIYDPKTNCYHETETMDPLFSGKDWIKTLNQQFHLNIKQLRQDLIDIFQMDNIIIKLFYIILLFSNQTSLNQSSEHQLVNINTLKIFKAQNVFTDLVYRYCVHKYGSAQASTLFLRYVSKLIKLQQLVDELKHTIDRYVDTKELSPLMQSLLV